MSPESSVQALAAPPITSLDPETRTLSRLVATFAEDAIFVLAASKDDPLSLLDGLARRRAEAYAAVVQGARTTGMVETFDTWVVEMARAMAPLAPPAWMP